MEIQKGETTSDWLFQKLSDEIINGLLKPNEKISEPSIAKRFGTSRAPVREAIRRMEERRLVNRKPHSGCRVASFSVENCLEIFEIREALEGVACRLATERMSDKHLSRLREDLEEQMQMSLSGEEFTTEKINRFRDFHYTIARGSQNITLTRLLCEDYYNLINLYRKRYSWIGSSEVRAQSIRAHLRILEAMEERDADFAETLMRRHIASAVIKLKEEYQDSLQKGTPVTADRFDKQ